MSSMRDLLEKMTFAGQAVGQKPGDQVRGSEPMPRKGGYKKHPYAGRLVGGGAESADESKEPYCDACDRVKSKCICDEPTAESLKEEFERFVTEYGAQGSAIGNDTGMTNADRVMQSQERVAGKQNTSAQISALSNELKISRAQLSTLNRSMPQGASPAEKAAALRDIQAQKIGIQSQIKALTSQIAQLRAQSF